MHIEAVAVYQLIDNGGRLFRAIRIQLDPVPARTRFCGNCQERCSIPDAWIDRRNRRSWVAQAGPDSPGFGNRQREVSETEPSLISHRYSFLVANFKGGPTGQCAPQRLVALDGALRDAAHRPR